MTVAAVLDRGVRRNAWETCPVRRSGGAGEHGIAQPLLREDYKKFRPNVERVISQVASRGGRRLKLRYLGTARNNAWLKNRTAALNLRTLISRGLARENGTWALA